MFVYLFQKICRKLYMKAEMSTKIEILKNLSTNQSQQINQLWNDEYPKNLNNRFPLLIQDTTDHNHYILSDQFNVILAWAVAFLREEEIWFSIIVSSANHKKGYGKMLINSLKKYNTELNGWVIDHNNYIKANGEQYDSPMGFYLKNDFKIIADDRIETDILSAVKIYWLKKEGA